MTVTRNGVSSESTLSPGGALTDLASETIGTLPSGAIGAHASAHITGGSDAIQLATASVPGLATAAQITKLDGIEALADVTDAANVDAAGAFMNSDVSSNGYVRRTGAGAYTTDTTATPATHASAHVTGGSDKIRDASSSQDGLMTTTYATKLDGVEALADVTDAANVTTAGAVMDGDFSTNGFMTRTGAGAYGTQVGAAPTTGIGAANSAGSAATPALSDHNHKLRTGSTDITIGTLTDGEYLKLVGTEIQSSTVSAGIGGSTGSTDNRILRADGTGGSTAQSSAATLDDAGALTGVTTVNAYRLGEPLIGTDEALTAKISAGWDRGPVGYVFPDIRRRVSLVETAPVLMRACPAQISGNIPYGFDFDGTARLRIASNSLATVWPYTSGFEVSAWAYPDALTNLACVWSVWSSTKFVVSLYMYLTGGNYKFLFDLCDGTTAQTVERYILHSLTLAATTLYWVSCYWEPGVGLGMSVNNGTVETTAFTGGIQTAGAIDFCLAGTHTGIQLWDGIIAQPLLSNQKLTAGNRTTLYGASGAGVRVYPAFSSVS